MNKQDIGQAKREVIAAGRRLLECGLIARTWGNVSCRIGDHRFAITPSGLAYDNLTPDKIVLVNTADCSYEGDLAPSSEKGVHAAVYRERRDVNFIIHTHQLNATALSPLDRDFPVTGLEERAILGERVRHIPYALSGTGKLRNNVARVLAGSVEKAFLMAAHGALCIGAHSEEVFRVAGVLEEFCRREIAGRYLALSGRQSCVEEDFYDYYVNSFNGHPGPAAYPAPVPLPGSEREGDYFTLHWPGDRGTGPARAGGPARYSLACSEGDAESEGGREFSRIAAVYRFIYRRRSDIGAILHSLSPDILAYSRTGQVMKPLVDDFAQIVGVSVRPVDPCFGGPAAGTAAAVLRGIRGRGAVLLKNNGALFCAPHLKDAAAMKMITEKNCRTYIAGRLFGTINPINPLECRLMRLVYLRRYSKRSEL